MNSTITYLPNDIYYILSKNLDYFSYLNLKLSSKKLDNINFLFFKRKAIIINNFFIKKFYSKFDDLKQKNRNGFLINLENILKNPNKYSGSLIQCISWFQYNFQYIEAGNIIEGFIFKDEPTDAWVIRDIYSNRIHPFLDPFIFPKSIRVIKSS